jgi:hypothetical protein
MVRQDLHCQPVIIALTILAVRITIISIHIDQIVENRRRGDMCTLDIIDVPVILLLGKERKINSERSETGNPRRS